MHLYCHHCDADHHIGRDAIVSSHHTSDGPVAYVRCPRGHLVVRALVDDWAHGLRDAVAA